MLIKKKKSVAEIEQDPRRHTEVKPQNQRENNVYTGTVYTGTVGAEHRSALIYEQRVS